MKHKPKFLEEETPQKSGRKREDIARKHINSGAVWFDFGDLSVGEDVVLDVKERKKSFTLSLSEVDKFYKRVAPRSPGYLVYLGEYVLHISVMRLNPYPTDLRDCLENRSFGRSDFLHFLKEDFIRFRTKLKNLLTLKEFFKHSKTLVSLINQLNSLISSI